MRCIRHRGLGVLYLLLGSASVGLSFVYAKMFLAHEGIPATALTTYQMGLGAFRLGLTTDLHAFGQLADNTQVLALIIAGVVVLHSRTQQQQGEDQQ